MEQAVPSRPTTTTAAAVLMLLVCIPFLINGWELIQLARDPSSLDAELREAFIITGNSASESQTRNFAVIALTLMLGLSFFAIVLASGVLRRREGSHQTAVVVFVMLGMIALASSITGLTADPPAPNARVGLLVGLVDIAIVVLLMWPSTRDDVEYMETMRARRKHARQDARAAARAARARR